MANVKLKRSSTPGKIPLTTDVELGELAMNTNDGKLFLKKDDGSESMVEVGGDIDGGDAGPLPSPIFTGSISDITVTNGEAITPVDVSSNFSTGGPVSSYSLQNNPSWLSIDSAGLITGTADAEAVSNGVTVTGSNIDNSADSNPFSVTSEDVSLPEEFNAYMVVDPIGSTIAGYTAVTGDYEVDFGDGVWVQYASGTSFNNVTTLGPNVYFRNQSGSTVTQFRFPNPNTGKEIHITNGTTLTSMYQAFYLSKSEIITCIGMNNVTNWDQAFMFCQSVTSINIDSTSAGTKFYRCFRDNSVCTCVNKIDTTKSTDMRDMFLNSPVYEQPNSSDQALIKQAGGYNWINANPCP